MTSRIEATPDTTEQHWSSSTRDRSRRSRIAVEVPWWRSLRVRTAAAIALLSLALVLVSGAVFAHSALDGARDQLRSQAIAQLQLGVADRAFGGALPSSVRANEARLPKALAASLEGSTISTFDDGTSMWAARRADSGTISTKLSNAPLDRQWAQLRVSFFWAALAALAVSTLLGWVVAGRLTARLRFAVQSINALVEGEPVTLPDARDEVGVLSRGITETALALSTRLDHEKAFAADVAHDLRTPLTALVSAVDLLDDGDDANRVRRQVRRMRGLVEDLLELARAEGDRASVHLDELPLGKTVEDIVLASPFADLCRIMIVRESLVRIDPRRLARAVENLVANSATHGRPPILLTVDGPCLTIVDHGDGFAPELLEQGPRRFSSAGNRAGSGLGLAIALRHLEDMDAEMTLSGRPQAGATVAVRFPC